MLGRPACVADADARVGDTESKCVGDACNDSRKTVGDCAKFFEGIVARKTDLATGGRDALKCPDQREERTGIFAEAKRRGQRFPFRATIETDWGIEAGQQFGGRAKTSPGVGLLAVRSHRPSPKKCKVVVRQ